MRTQFKLAMLTLAVVGLVAGVAAIASNVTAGVSAASKDTVPVVDFRDHAGIDIMNPKERGTSDLVRTVDGLSINIDTVDLPVGSYTLWWAIFNNPSACTDGCDFAMDTGRGDMPNPAEGSVLWGTGGLVGPDRMAHFSFSLGSGGVDDAPGAVLRGPALTNPMGAEVHVLVRYHGPTMWGDAMMFTNQLTRVHGGCPNEDGPFPCYDPQITYHMAPAGSMMP